VRVEPEEPPSDVTVKGVQDRDGRGVDRHQRLGITVLIRSIHILGTPPALK